MSKSYILVLDSGVGGVSILKSLKNKLPAENFIYLADNKFSPYGNKSKRFLQQNIINILNKIFDCYKIKLVIFACNTITATTIKKVRKKFSVKFVGTEPPIKQLPSNEKSLILSTEQTLKSSLILKKFKNNKSYDFVGLKNIASMLDNNFFNRKIIVESLEKQLPKKEYVNVVLGCTHYYFLEEEIKKVLNKDNLNFYKSTKGVINRVLSLVETTESNNPETIIKLTKEDKNLYNTINFLLNY